MGVYGCRGLRPFSTRGIAPIPRYLSERAVDRTPGNTEMLRDRSGTHVGTAWLETGPILNARVRPRRVPLLGPDARE